MRAGREPKNNAKNLKKVHLRNHKTCFFTCSPRPPTLSQRHMDLHVWAYPRPGYIFQVSSKFVQGFRSPGVKIWPFPLLWLVAFTTACTAVQAVIRVSRQSANNVLDSAATTTTSVSLSSCNGATTGVSSSEGREVLCVELNTKTIS